MHCVEIRLVYLKIKFKTELCNCRLYINYLRVIFQFLIIRVKNDLLVKTILGMKKSIIQKLYIITFIFKKIFLSNTLTDVFPVCYRWYLHSAK